MLVVRLGVVCLLALLAASRATAAADQAIHGTLTTVDGRAVQLASEKPATATVLLFLSTECPISSGYVPTLNRLADQWKDDPRVAFYGVISDRSVTRNAAAKYAKEYEIAFPLLLDASGLLARQLMPTHVPEAFVLDAHLQVKYRGRIDDLYADLGKRRAQATEHNLVDATSALLAGKVPAIAQTTPIGCLFEAPVAGASDSGPTYTRDIAPLVNAQCVICHRSGEVAPFALSSYQDLAKRAKQVQRVVERKIMPPWMPADGHGDFLNRRQLTAAEIELFAAWVKAGTPEGDPADLPPAPQFTPGWRLGEPDLVLKMPVEFKIPADGPDLFQNFVIPVDIPADKLVAAIDFQPGNQRVVHHTILFLDDKGRARKRDDATPEPGYSSFGGPGFTPSGSIGGWSPGNVPKRLPDNMGRYLKKGSDVVMQIHYHPTGKPETDQSKVGIYFVDKPKNVVAAVWATSYQIDIPAGESNYQLTTSYKLPYAVTMVGVVPHMHLLGKSMKATAILPDGTERSLIWVKDWVYNWQDEYHYREPFRLPAGTELRVESAWDNSANNPLNPRHPPERVTWGEQTQDEMSYCFFLVAADQPLQLIPLMVDNLKHDSQLRKLNTQRK